MTIRLPAPLRMTALERSPGRFMRGPDGHADDSRDNGTDDDDELDNDEQDDDNEDQSGDAEGDDSNDDDQDADDQDEGNSDDDGAKAKPKNGYERRIDRLTRQLNEERNKNRSKP